MDKRDKLFVYTIGLAGAILIAVRMLPMYQNNVGNFLGIIGNVLILVFWFYFFLKYPKFPWNKP